MVNRIQTHEYNLVDIVQRQSPERRAEMVDAITDTLKGMVLAEVMQTTIRNRFTVHPPRYVFMDFGKSRLASAIEQGNHVI